MKCEQTVLAELDEKTQAALGRLARFERDWSETHPGDPLCQLCTEAARHVWVAVMCRAAVEVLEVGCGTGRSTLWIASALERIEGRMVAIDPDEYRLGVAREMVNAAGLAERVSFSSCVLDTPFLLQNFPRGIDLAFLDCPKHLYAPYTRTIMPLMKSGSVLMADNAHSHREELAEFFALMEDLSRRECVASGVVSVGAGLLVATRLGSDNSILQ